MLLRVDVQREDIWWGAGKLTSFLSASAFCWLRQVAYTLKPFSPRRKAKVLPNPVSQPVIKMILSRLGST